MGRHDFYSVYLNTCATCTWTLFAGAGSYHLCFLLCDGYCPCMPLMINGQKTGSGLIIMRSAASLVFIGLLAFLSQRNLFNNNNDNNNVLRMRRLHCSIDIIPPPPQQTTNNSGLFHCIFLIISTSRYFGQGPSSGQLQQNVEGW